MLHPVAAAAAAAASPKECEGGVAAAAAAAIGFESGTWIMSASDISDRQTLGKERGGGEGQDFLSNGG